MELEDGRSLGISQSSCGCCDARTDYNILDESRVNAIQFDAGLQCRAKQLVRRCIREGTLLGSCQSCATCKLRVSQVGEDRLEPTVMTTSSARLAVLTPVGRLEARRPPLLCSARWEIAAERRANLCGHPIIRIVATQKQSQRLHSEYRRWE